MPDKLTKATLHLCVVVRTHLAQRTKLLALLSSLQAAAEGICPPAHWLSEGSNARMEAQGLKRKLSMSVHVVSTDIAANATPSSWNGQARDAEDTRSNVQRLAPLLSQNVRVFSVHAHPHADAPRLREYWKQRCSRRDGSVKPLFYDFGYLQADLAMHELLQQRDNGEARECDYVTVTNGDNLYSNALLRFACPPMHSGFDLIAWHCTVARTRTLVIRAHSVR